MYTPRITILTKSNEKKNISMARAQEQHSIKSDGVVFVPICV